MSVLIVDYGLGNLWSVKNAFEFVGAEVTVSANPAEVAAANCLVLPGVGSFGTGMHNLRTRGLDAALNEAVLEQGAHIMGICLGMQLLADGSEEAPGVQGLGLISGQVMKFRDNSLRLPHMGFNAVVPVGVDSNFFQCAEGGMLDFYFVHSYCFVPNNESHVLTRTNYGGEFVSAVQKGNIIGVQFHPEKSQSNGLLLIRHFVNLSSGNRNG
jgi:glutamine amidotransferase